MIFHLQKQKEGEEMHHSNQVEVEDHYQIQVILMMQKHLRRLAVVVILLKEITLHLVEMEDHQVEMMNLEVVEDRRKEVVAVVS